MTRDFAAEMRALIDAETANGPYVSRVVAAEAVEKLRANDPELLDGWLANNAETFVWQMINDRDRGLRSHARQTSGRSVFAADAKEHAAGNSTPLVRWLTVPFSTADGARKRLADMTADDLTFAADSYEARARDNRMTAAFLRAISRKVNTDTVGKHFTDEQLSAMWKSLTGADSQGNPAAILDAGVLVDGSDFPLDSVFAEYGYLIDSDSNTFEAYRGFQKEKHDKGRFADREPFVPEWRKDKPVEYWPCALVASWPLAALPTDDEFCVAIDGPADEDDDESVSTLDGGQ